MNAAEAVAAVLTALVVAAGFLVAVVVSARQKGHEETEKRLRNDRDDYKGRVEFMEPRLAKALDDNALLQQMHDPTQALAEIKVDTAMIRTLLESQAADIQEAIDSALGGQHG